MSLSEDQISNLESLTETRQGLTGSEKRVLHVSKVGAKAIRDALEVPQHIKNDLEDMIDGGGGYTAQETMKHADHLADVMVKRASDLEAIAKALKSNVAKARAKFKPRR